MRCRVVRCLMQKSITNQASSKNNKDNYVGGVDDIDNDDELVQTLLLLRLSSAEVKQRGAVLLNLPRSVAQYNALCGRSACASIVRVAMAATVKHTQPVCTQRVIRAMEALVNHMRHTGPLVLDVPLPHHPCADVNLSSLTHAMQRLEKIQG
uniref:Adenylate kinase n=1 Tax=Lygus hesperus TaxID=30085 RepID=A0A0A9XBG4_LYGHE